MLRYKNYQLVAKPEAVNEAPEKISQREKMISGTVQEVFTVKEFAAQMDEMGCLAWWRVRMGFVGDNGDGPT